MTHGRYVIYAAVLLGSVAVLKKSDSNAGVAIAVIVALFIISRLHHRYTSHEEEKKTKQMCADEKKRYDDKIVSEGVFPKMKTQEERYQKFVFFVQEYHEYNPLAFEKMIDSIDALLEIKRFVVINPKNVHTMWDIAETHKLQAINALHSIVHSLPNDPTVEKKIGDAAYHLERELEKDMMVMYEIYRKDVSNGRDVNTKQIDLGPKPFNSVESNDYTYDFYH